jgi:poly(A) polymerase
LQLTRRVLRYGSASHLQGIWDLSLQFCTGSSSRSKQPPIYVVLLTAVQSRLGRQSKMTLQWPDRNSGLGLSKTRSTLELEGVTIGSFEEFTTESTCFALPSFCSDRVPAYSSLTLFPATIDVARNNCGAFVAQAPLDDNLVGDGRLVDLGFGSGGARMDAVPVGERKFEEALTIVEKLRAAGFEAYLAGGCVRDLLLGRAPADYDVATSATPDVVLEMFERTYAVGAKFGVVLVAPEDAEFVTEVATFRSDGAYSDGRRPDAVRYSQSAEEDVQRRDFTINGLLLDPLSAGGALHEIAAQRERIRAVVLDYVGGMRDLEAGVVRAIGSAELRFEEDHLRMLRAVRFAARFGFELEPETGRAIRSLAKRANGVSRERVRDELTKMLTEGRAQRAFELLDETGLLKEVLPEIARMKGVEQPPQFHPEGDVWVHTLMLLEQLGTGCSTTLAWGALLHDVGKPPTFRRAPDRIRFDGHVEIGVTMAAEICRRLRFSNEETRQILALIENHMRFMDTGRMKESTLKRFLRLPQFDEHLALHKMDCLAGSGFLEHWEFMREKLQTMPEEAVRPKPLLTGNELIAAGYRPGPKFKEMLHEVEDAQLEGRIGSEGEALSLVRERFGEAPGC